MALRADALGKRQRVGPQTRRVTHRRRSKQPRILAAELRRALVTDGKARLGRIWVALWAKSEERVGERFA